MGSESLWLGDDQQEVWRAFLAAIAVIDDHLDSALRPYGLDLGEYEILVELSEAEDWRLRMSELAQAVRQSRSRLTHTVARMEKKELIKRVSSPEDRRGVIAVLTKKGFMLLETAAPIHVRSVRDCFVDVVEPRDFKALGRAMDAVVQSAG
jgi:DNA-binding MarR family transcriptional regulator